jgi:hypothetical protein
VIIEWMDRGVTVARAKQGESAHELDGEDTRIVRPEAVDARCLSQQRLAADSLERVWMVRLEGSF